MTEKIRIIDLTHPRQKVGPSLELFGRTIIEVPYSHGRISILGHRITGTSLITEIINFNRNRNGRNRVTK